MLMKPTLLFCSALLLLASCSSPKTTAQFYQAHKKRPGVTNFQLPGWAVWLTGGIVYNSTKNEETKAALRIARKVGKLRLMASEGARPIPTEQINQFMGNIKQNGYEDLLQVKDGSSTVNILARDRRNKIRNLLLLVSDEDGFVFIDLKSRIKYDEISDLINFFLNRDKAEEQEETPADEPPADNRPRA